jgi:heme-degrading monooxygenase HmoA
MHVRLSRFAGLPPERVDQTIQEFEQGALPQLQQLDGYKGVMVMVNRGTGQAAAVTFWETEADLKASDKLAGQARDQAVQTAQPEREPVVDRYEVLLRKDV